MPNKDWNDEITPFPLINRATGSQIRSKTAAQPGQPPKTIKVLLIEDNQGDVRLIKEFLAEISGLCFELETADRLAAGLARLREPGIDIVLLDLSLPDSR